MGWVKVSRLVGGEMEGTDEHRRSCCWTFAAHVVVARSAVAAWAGLALLTLADGPGTVAPSLTVPKGSMQAGGHKAVCMTLVITRY